MTITVFLNMCTLLFFFFFFFNDTATTEIYTLSLHDALPIWRFSRVPARPSSPWSTGSTRARGRPWSTRRSEEHTSELQSQSNLVCRLLLEKKKKYIISQSILVQLFTMFLSIPSAYTSRFAAS